MTWVISCSQSSGTMRPAYPARGRLLSCYGARGSLRDNTRTAQVSGVIEVTDIRTKLLAGKDTQPLCTEAKRVNRQQPPGCPCGSWCSAEHVSTAWCRVCMHDTCIRPVEAPNRRPPGMLGASMSIPSSTAAAQLSVCSLHVRSTPLLRGWVCADGSPIPL